MHKKNIINQKTKNCNIPKILLSCSLNEFSLPKSHRWFKTCKTFGEDGGSVGQLYFFISDILHSPIVFLFPLHDQPAPASTCSGLPYVTFCDGHFFSVGLFRSILFFPCTVNALLCSVPFSFRSIPCFSISRYDAFICCHSRVPRRWDFSFGNR